MIRPSLQPFITSRRGLRLVAGLAIALCVIGLSGNIRRLGETNSLAIVVLRRVASADTRLNDDPAACKGDAADANVQYLCGLDAVNGGRQSDAENWFGRLQGHARSMAADYAATLGQRNVQSGRLEEARTDFTVAWTLETQHMSYASSLVSVLLSLHDYGATREALAQMGEPADPSDRRQALLLRTEYLRGIGSFDEATRVYEGMIADDPASAEPYVGLGLIALAEHDYNRALTMWNTASAHAPADATPYALRGEVYLNYLGQPARAIPELRRFLELHGADDPSVLSDYVKASEQVGKVAAARFYLDSLTSQGGGPAHVWCLLGSVDHESGNNQAASRALDFASRSRGFSPSESACQRLSSMIASDGH